MHRDDWDAVYDSQDQILNALRGLNSDIFLAGGTGLHRFVLPLPYRHLKVKIPTRKPNRIITQESLNLRVIIPNTIKTKPF